MSVSNVIDTIFLRHVRFRFVWLDPKKTEVSDAFPCVEEWVHRARIVQVIDGWSIVTHRT